MVWLYLPPDAITHGRSAAETSEACSDYAFRTLAAAAHIEFNGN